MRGKARCLAVAALIEGTGAFVQPVVTPTSEPNVATERVARRALGAIRHDLESGD